MAVKRSQEKGWSTDRALDGSAAECLFLLRGELRLCAVSAEFGWRLEER